MYDFAHGQSDAIEGITHSICTLEFEDHRPLYDWFLDAAGIRTAAADRVRAAQPHLHGDEQAQSCSSWCRRPRQRLGRPAHADARGPAPPRLHARGDPRLLRAIGVAKANSTVDMACSSTACAKT
jgi:glutaminyl-tRNA synthetase